VKVESTSTFEIVDSFRDDAKYQNVKTVSGYKSGGAHVCSRDRHLPREVTVGVEQARARQRVIPATQR